MACEAKRIDLAFLFDPMMAVHSSNVEPLPHQITAVYESLLPRQPLRFVLADDPGAGKTIMAGLYISELIMRANSRRILIVAPGSLVEQWRDELFEKFGLEFHIYSSLLEQTSPSGNPFDDFPRLIIRLDQISRNVELQDKLCCEGDEHDGTEPVGDEEPSLGSIERHCSNYGAGNDRTGDQSLWADSPGGDLGRARRRRAPGGCRTIVRLVRSDARSN